MNQKHLGNTISREAELKLLNELYELVGVPAVGNGIDEQYAEEICVAMRHRGFSIVLDAGKVYFEGQGVIARITWQGPLNWVPTPLRFCLAARDFLRELYKP